MTLEETSKQPCSVCGDKKKGKLAQIIEGWENVIFEDPEVEKIAKYRALRCATCDFNKLNFCTKCTCPIIAATRSMDKDCPIGRWNK